MSSDPFTWCASYLRLTQLYNFSEEPYFANIITPSTSITPNFMMIRDLKVHYPYQEFYISYFH